MTQYDFDKLMEKYLKGETIPEEDIFLDEWAARQNPSDMIKFSNRETDNLKLKIWRRISKKSFSPNYRIFSAKMIGIAASFLVMMAVGLWYFMDDGSKGAYTYKGIEMKNTTDIPQLITLKDGSTVKLQPNSTLTFPEKFDEQNRIVYLEGEGFFDVKKDPTKPFFVYAGNLVTKVLGTSFTVKSYDNEKVSEVIVVSGKVMVYNTEGSKKGNILTQKAVLTPNKKVVFEKTTNEIKTELVEKPVIVNPPQSTEAFLFRQVAVTEVLKRLERMYGVEIVQVDDLKGCDFTGDLNDLDLDAQLYFITNTINGYYERQDTKILIFSQGC